LIGRPALSFFFGGVSMLQVQATSTASRTADSRIAPMRSAVAICALMASWFPYVKTILGGANLRTPMAGPRLFTPCTPAGWTPISSSDSIFSSAERTKSKVDELPNGGLTPSSPPLASPSTSRANPDPGSRQRREGRPELQCPTSRSGDAGHEIEIPNDSYANEISD